MIATVAVPPSVVYVRLNVLPGSRGRYLLTLDPGRAAEIGLLDLAEGDTPEDRAAHAMLLLADAVAAALGAEPIRFVSEGRLVGRVEIIESPFGSHVARVRGHVSLTLLSWALRDGLAGYYLGLPGP